MNAEVTIDMLAYWHVGSGRGRGADADALVLKDPSGLPFLPGKSLKGLLREGLLTCEEAGQVAPGRTAALFGSPASGGASTPGKLVVGNACLPEKEKRWLASDAGAASRVALYDTVASTKLDENGMAQTSTLRTIELCVPMRLAASIRGPDEGGWLEDLEKACAFIRGVGAHRNRGLGRCRCSIQNGGKGHE